MIFKQYLAYWIRHVGLLRWGIRMAVRLLVPQHYVGAVGVIFNEAGQVLLVEHVFRAYYPWGLPGGWVERHEDPADAIRRELKEELNLEIEVRKLLLCQPQGHIPENGNAPPGLGLAYYCRLLDEAAALQRLAEAEKSYEVLATQWLAPEEIPYRLAPLQQEAIMLAQSEFANEQRQQLAQQPIAR